MTPQEIRQIVESVIADKQIASYWYLLGLLIVVGLSAFLGTYLSTKGTNLATKEDIGRITDEIEKVKLAYAEQLERHKQELESRYRLEEKGAENAFILSATSHMAEKAFDKHVEFCEKYVAKAHEGLEILLRVGPRSRANSGVEATSEALNIAKGLYQIRLEFVLWETKEVALVLGRFEKALCQIGADQGLLQAVTDQEEYMELIHKIYEKFKEVTTLETLPDKPTPEIAITNIIARLQDHVGVSQLTELRKHYLVEAEKRIKPLGGC